MLHRPEFKINMRMNTHMIVSEKQHDSLSFWSNSSDLFRIADNVHFVLELLAVRVVPVSCLRQNYPYPGRWGKSSRPHLVCLLPADDTVEKSHFLSYLWLPMRHLSSSHSLSFIKLSLLPLPDKQSQDNEDAAATGKTLVLAHSPMLCVACLMMMHQLFLDR